MRVKSILYHCEFFFFVGKFAMKPANTPHLSRKRRLKPKLTKIGANAQRHAAGRKIYCPKRRDELRGWPPNCAQRVDEKNGPVAWQPDHPSPKTLHDDPALQSSARAVFHRYKAEQSLKPAPDSKISDRRKAVRPVSTKRHKPAPCHRTWQVDGAFEGATRNPVPARERRGVKARADTDEPLAIDASLQCAFAVSLAPRRRHAARSHRADGQCEPWGPQI